MTTEPGSNTRLRAARQALGLRSQQHLADAVTRAGAQIGLRVSITERTVRRWESENPPWPQNETAGRDVRQLLHGSGSGRPISRA